MGIVGANSTAGREVKFIDPSKTTKSESSWLGYTLCDYIYFMSHTHTHTQLTLQFTHTHIHAKQIQRSLRIAYYIYIYITLYNEERRLGEQRGSDTPGVPLITSNGGLSITFFIQLHIYPAYKMTWLELVFFIRSPNFFRTVSMDVSFIFFACKRLLFFDT